MKRLQFSAGVLAFSILSLAVSTRAQSDYMPPMSGWPAAIQTAWQIQGEYYGNQNQDTTKHLGAWLCANGGTSYGLVILPGGLLSMFGQPYGGWDKVTRYQGTAGPVAGTLTGTTFRVITSSGGFTSDSITGTGENRTLYVHNSDGTTYSLQRVKRHSPTFGLKWNQVKGKVLGADSVVSLFDSATAQADLTKWVAGENAVQLKYNYLYRGIKTVGNFGRNFLHIEFLSCFNPTATNQGRANSGIYQQGRFETQVLDSFGQNPGIDQYGSIYSIKAPDFNAELPPQVTFQTYDIFFTPKTATAAAYFTVYANGVLVQDSTLAANTTTASYVSLGTNDQPLYLQNHSNEIVFTNIWMVPNASVHTLNYNSILALTVPPTALKNNVAAPFAKTHALKVLGFDGNYDLTGREIHNHGSVPSLQPTVLFNPKNP